MSSTQDRPASQVVEWITAVQRHERVESMTNVVAFSASSIHNRRRALTLVELMVTIGVIALLIALVLPALQAAREAARRSRCLSNLKQLGIACSTYESIHGTWPCRSYYAPHAVLLPGLEQAALYNSINFNFGWATDPTGANMTAGWTSVSLFLCPTDVGLPASGTN